MIRIQRHYVKKNCSCHINIKVLADIHFSSYFKVKKLEKIKMILEKDPTDYIFIVGDLLDSTNVLKDKRKTNELITWIKDLALIAKVFICLGNHDLSKFDKREKKLKYDFNHSFWKKISNLNNVYVSHYSNYFEDSNIIIYMLEQSYDYYYTNGKHFENKNILINLLEQIHFKKDNDKIKILLVHSPIKFIDSKIQNLVKNLDIIFSGHMHNGLFPTFVNKILPGNRGLIAPDKTLFPNNARGVKKYNINKKEVYHIINGGIIKLSETAGCLKYFNDLFFSSNIDNVYIRSNKKSQ